LKYFTSAGRISDTTLARSGGSSVDFGSAVIRAVRGFALVWLDDPTML
jgi:hypothetical protein